MVAGEHEYGVQLDGQLDFVGLPRAAAAEAADLVVLCGLAGHPEVARAAALGLPVVAFDGVQGGAPIPDCSLMLPFAPGDDMGGTTAAARGRDADLRGRRRRCARPHRPPLRAPDRGPVRRARRPVDPPVLALPRGRGLVT